jgi:hypothetical protein
MALAAALLGGGKVPFISWGTESELFSRMTDVGGKVEWRTTRALCIMLLQHGRREAK